MPTRSDAQNCEISSQSPLFLFSVKEESAVNDLLHTRPHFNPLNHILILNIFYIPKLQTRKCVSAGPITTGLLTCAPHTTTDSPRTVKVTQACLNSHALSEHTECIADLKELRMQCIRNINIAWSIRSVYLQMKLSGREILCDTQMDHSFPVSQISRGGGRGGGNAAAALLAYFLPFTI